MAEYKISVKIEDTLLVTTETGDWDNIVSEREKSKTSLTEKGFVYKSYQLSGGVVESKYRFPSHMTRNDINQFIIAFDQASNGK